MANERPQLPASEIEDELLAGLFGARVTKIGLLNIHDKYASMVFWCKASARATSDRALRLRI